MKRMGGLKSSPRWSVPHPSSVPGSPRTGLCPWGEGTGLRRWGGWSMGGRPQKPTVRPRVFPSHIPVSYQPCRKRPINPQALATEGRAPACRWELFEQSRSLPRPRRHVRRVRGNHGPTPQIRPRPHSRDQPETSHPKPNFVGNLLSRK